MNVVNSSGSAVAPFTLVEKSPSEDIMSLVDAGSIYLKASVQKMQKIISSTFPEKIIFQNKKCRTLKINDSLQVMLLKYNDLPEIKKGQIN